MTSESITVTNHTKKSIQFITVQDSMVAEADRKKTYHIDPQDSLVLFTDRVVSLNWERNKTHG